MNIIDHREGSSQKSKTSIGREVITKNLPFIFFLGLLGLVNIASAHMVSSKLRKIKQKKVVLKELNWQYMSVKSDILYGGTLSKLSDDLEKEEIGFDGAAPLIIEEK